MLKTFHKKDVNYLSAETNWDQQVPETNQDQEVLFIAHVSYIMF